MEAERALRSIRGGDVRKEEEEEEEEERRESEGCVPGSAPTRPGQTREIEADERAPFLSGIDFL